MASIDEIRMRKTGLYVTGGFDTPPNGACVMSPKPCHFIFESHINADIYLFFKFSKYKFLHMVVCFFFSQYGLMIYSTNILAADFISTALKKNMHRNAP